jgi:GTP-binding protein HflX
MSSTVSGNLKGLSPSEKKSLDKLSQRKLNAEDLVSSDFAKELAILAQNLRRRIGALVTREGRIEKLFIGSKDILYLPELSRHKEGRLKKLRFVFSDLSNKETVDIPQDIYGDLEIHSFDAVIAVKQIKNVTRAKYAYLTPNNVGGDLSQSISVEVPDIGSLKLDFLDFITDLENEFASSPKVKKTVNGAILIGVHDKPHSYIQERLLELEELSRTAGVIVLDKYIQKKRSDPKTYIGSGKLEEITLQALRLGADSLIFDCELLPTQWRAITNATSMKVLDRSMLILDIFAQRAKSSEGRLQVELAQLKYNLPRLIEKDTGLSRLTGGIGGRGPGETKLEISRRRSRDKITLLEKKIKELAEVRELKRTKRKKSLVPSIAIVGYTNVGKSSLFNAITKGDAFIENKLFATLDTTQRPLHLVSESGSKEVILSDTVGFIRDLPKELMAAFQATLEEVSESTVLLHVLDVSDPEIHNRYKNVRKILEDVDVTDIPEIILLNKVDKTQKDIAQKIQQDFPGSILTSSITREGFEELRKKISLAITSVGNFEN